MNTGGNWAKSLTGNEGSIILDPAWYGEPGFKLAQLVFGENISPGSVGGGFPPEFWALRSFAGAPVWVDRASGELPSTRNRDENGNLEGRKKINARVDFPSPLG
jgi:hypothetical protein